MAGWLAAPQRRPGKAAARKEPGDLAYGTAGIGGDDHIAALLLEEKAGVRLNHIPFNGTSQLLVPLLGGQLDIGAFNLSEALPLLRDRAIRGIALAASERDAAAPEIPSKSIFCPAAFPTANFARL